MNRRLKLDEVLVELEELHYQVETQKEIINLYESLLFTGVDF